MRKPLLIGLALALGATWWLSSQEPADEVEVLARPRPPGSAAQVTASPASPPSAGVAPEARLQATVQSMVQSAMLAGLQGWTERRSDARELPPPRPMTSATPSAWASQQPPPPPPPPKRTQPEVPQAPRFPHAWVGRYSDESAQRAVVSGPVSTWVVRAGDVIEGQWRIDSIQNRTMTLTYLPMQQSQTVSMK